MYFTIGWESRFGTGSLVRPPKGQTPKARI